MNDSLETISGCWAGFVAAIISLPLACILFIVIGQVTAQSSDICKDPGDGAWVIEGREAVFNTIAAGLLMTPKDLRLKPVQWIYANDQKTAGYFVMDSQPAKQRWVFVYPLIDPPDRQQGIHDFCMVWIYDLTR